MASRESLLPNLSTIAEFVISPLFAWMWCSFIILYSFRWLVALQWETIKIKTHLKEALKCLKVHQDPHELTVNFRTLHTQIMALAKMRQPWREFCQSLIFPSPPPERGDADNEPKTSKGLVKATRYTEDFFNTTTLVQPYIDTRFFAGLPTQLTGLGILGTFCSLACGIYIAHDGLAGGNMAETQKSLSQLLGGAGLAFTKSVVGIFASLLFARMENISVKSLHTLIAQFNADLHNRIEFVTVEKLSSVHVQQNHAHSQQLERIANLLETMHSSRSEANEKVVQQIVREFRATMSNAASEEITYIATAFKQIHHALKDTKEAIALTGHNLSTTTDAATKAFKKNLHEVTHQFHSNFSQTTETIQATFKEAAKDVSLAFNQSATNFHDVLRKPADNLSVLLVKLNQQVSQTNEIWQQNNLNQVAQAGKILATHAKASEIIAPLVRASQAITAACKESQDSLRDSAQAAKQISGAVVQMDDISKRLQGNWEDYCKRFEGVDRSLHQVVQQTNHSLNQYSERMHGFTHDLDKHMSKSLLSLAGAVGDLNQVVNHLPEAMHTLRKGAATSTDKPYRPGL